MGISYKLNKRIFDKVTNILSHKAGWHNCMVVRPHMGNECWGAEYTPYKLSQFVGDFDHAWRVSTHESSVWKVNLTRIITTVAVFTYDVKETPREAILHFYYFDKNNIIRRKELERFLESLQSLWVP